MKKIDQAQELGQKILDEHNVSHKLKFNNTRNTVGTTNHDTKVITLSRFFVKLATVEDFKGVLLHEITHALLGPGHGHGPEFMAKCREIGGFDVISKSYHIHTYRGSCSECGQTGTTNVRKRNVLCGLCSANDKFNIIELTKNEIKETVW